MIPTSTRRWSRPRRVRPARPLVETDGTVRSGLATIMEGSASGWSMNWRRKWLALSADKLDISDIVRCCTSEFCDNCANLGVHQTWDRKETTSILISSITKIEQVNLSWKQFCLLVETADTQFCIGLKDERVYNDWANSIYTLSPLNPLNHRSPWTANSSHEDPDSSVCGTSISRQRF